eukprot:TRINITY_DN3034_c0_g1_i1.p1 TRINITY_DN3034_c0_g1~~TRINITY_DN3034_c0_g1_i1.p1  ORF type:complete len:667 (-),score=103.41 TRINITY_DN3034_c0_g1_i1:70-2070(-)
MSALLVTSAQGIQGASTPVYAAIPAQVLRPSYAHAVHLPQHHLQAAAVGMAPAIAPSPIHNAWSPVVAVPISPTSTQAWKQAPWPAQPTGAVEPVTVRSAAVAPTRQNESNQDQQAETARAVEVNESTEMPETAILELKQQIGGLRDELRHVRTNLDSQLRKQSEEGGAPSELVSVLRRRVNSLCEELADCGAEALKLRCNLGTHTSSCRSRSAPSRQVSQLQGFASPVSPRSTFGSQVLQVQGASSVISLRLQSDPRLSSGPSISSYLAGALSPRVPQRLLSGVSASPSSYRIEPAIVRGLSGRTEPITIPSRVHSTSSQDPRALSPAVNVVTTGAVRVRTPSPSGSAAYPVAVSGQMQANSIAVNPPAGSATREALQQGLLRSSTASSGLGPGTPELSPPLSNGNVTANSSCKNSRASLHGQEHGGGRRFKDSAMKAKLGSPNFLTRMVEMSEEMNSMDYSARAIQRIMGEENEVPIEEDTSFTCPNCGNVYMADSIYCRHCGVKRSLSHATSPLGGSRGSKCAPWPGDLAAERLLQQEVANQLREMAMLRADNARLSDRLISAGFDASETLRPPSTTASRQSSSPRGSSAVVPGGRRRSAMEPVREGSPLGRTALWHKPGRLPPKEPSMAGGWSPRRTTEHWTSGTSGAGARKSQLSSSKARA